MGYYCTVPQCTSLAGKTKNVKFHRFPRDIPMADKWNVILKRGKPYTKYSKVCSLHFTQADYNVTTMGQWKTLSKDAVPSQNLPKLNPDGTVMVIRKSRTVKYRETRKEDGEKEHKWLLPTPHTPALTNLDTVHEPQDSNLSYRLQTLSAIASNMPPQPPLQPSPSKPKKQDAIMQTDPVQSEEDETQPNNSYSEASDTSFNSEQLEYPAQYKDNQKKSETDYSYKEKEYSIKTYEQPPKRFDSPKDYTKDDYIPQTNEEYNKEAEKYALERKSLSNYEKIDTGFQKPVVGTEYEKEAEKYILERKSHYEKLDVYPKPVAENGYQKLPDVYAFNDGKEYQTRNDYVGYQNGYPDSVDVLRNQQHNIQMLQEQHRVSENQNFFNDNPIKQEILNEEDKFLYERTKEQLDATALYGGHRSLTQQQRLLEHLQHQVKQEPDASGSDSVMQPQGSPYYAANGHTNAAGYYEQISRPGPELLIAKQNALAAHTQLWHNTMKRPFFYSETSHYSAPQLLHRYTTEDLTRILQ